MFSKLRKLIEVYTHRKKSVTQVENARYPTPPPNLNPKSGAKPAFPYKSKSCGPNFK